jgi:ABC-2 type transport system permease protein
MTALRAEWTKLRSVRSTTWALLALAGLTIAFGAVSSSTSHTEGGSVGDAGDENVVMVSLAGLYFAQVAAVALGALAVCSEYATGTVRATFAANPRRAHVMCAKVAIVGALVLAVGAAATVAAFYLGQAILHGNGFVTENGYPPASLADGDTLRTVALAGAYPVVLALLSLGTGAIFRHSATAISVLLGVLFVPWIVGSLLPEDLGNAIETATPMAGLAGQQKGAPIGPWEGLGVTTAWAAVALLVGLWLMRRRDAQRQWWSSGSSSISRRVLRIQTAIVPIDSSAPAMTSTIVVVMPTMPSVMPKASSTGWMLGPGRWISSPAGGMSASSGLMRCRSPRRRRSCRT